MGSKVPGERDRSKALENLPYFHNQVVFLNSDQHKLHQQTMLTIATHWAEFFKKLRTLKYYTRFTTKFMQDYHIQMKV